MKPTPKQLALLAKFRIGPAHIADSATATEVINAIRDNGWRRPRESQLAQIIVGDVIEDEADFPDDHGDL